MRRALTLLSIATLTLLAAPASAEDPAPADHPDGSWISLGGVVVDTTPDQFTLDHGDGLITVEMDDWGWYGDARGLLEGDRVTVQGQIDNALHEERTIEAGAVYVESLNTYFRANSADEEGDPIRWFDAHPVDEGLVRVHGTITSASPARARFTLDTGRRELTVETDRMPHDPLDDVGYQRLDVGDVVSARGELDSDLLKGRVLRADAVISLEEQRGTTL